VGGVDSRGADTSQTAATTNATTTANTKNPNFIKRWKNIPKILFFNLN
jgi:GH25 family lysozyme M1 (1,4-beta-N-acetylmuramidase)